MVARVSKGQRAKLMSTNFKYKDKPVQEATVMAEIKEFKKIVQNLRVMFFTNRVPAQEAFN
jgi:hypothetical protein